MTHGIAHGLLDMKWVILIKEKIKK
jgi:hypothetical protein